MREGVFGFTGSGPMFGANGYQLKLTGCPMKPPGLRCFSEHAPFHGPWLST